MKMIRSRNTLLISVMIFSEIRWGLISKNAIDTSDSTYQKWTTDKDISLKDYLTYAASQNWIDISKFFLQKEIIWIPMKYIRLLQIICRLS